MEYGEIYVGEATMFLRGIVDPLIMYYALSAPKGDVGASTGWNKRGNQPNNSTRPVVGQAATFTLHARQTPPRGQCIDRMIPRNLSTTRLQNLDDTKNNLHQAQHNTYTTSNGNEPESPVL